MRKRNITTELEKIDKKVETVKAKKIVELTEEFTSDPLGFMGIDTDTKQEIVTEILTRKITPKFDSDPRTDKFDTKFKEWNWLQNDPRIDEVMIFGLNLEAKPFLGEHPDTFSVVETEGGSEVKLLLDSLHPCKVLKGNLSEKDQNLDYLIGRCQKLLESESQTFEKFVEKVKKKEDYFDIMAKEQI